MRDRGGLARLDYTQNVINKTLVAPYSLRAAAGAPLAEADAFDAVIDAFIEAARGAPTRAVLMASLPETLNRTVRERCMRGGVIPLQGLRESLAALAQMRLEPERDQQVTGG